MASRMDRYSSNEESQLESRTVRNQKKYDDLYTSVTYTNFSSVDSNIIDLSNIKDSSSRREVYQKSKGASFQNEEIQEVKDYEYPTFENKMRDFDINRVLEEARKNRDEDELEKKRKLKTTEYNILIDLSEEKLKEYRQEKKEVLTEEDEKNIEELINTITSKTMSQDIKEAIVKERGDLSENVNSNNNNVNISDSETEIVEDSLLDELMPTKIDETIISGTILEEIETVVETISTDELEDDEIEEDDESDIKNTIDDSFYTKSMELSKEDLVSEEETNKDDLEDEDIFADDLKTSTWLKVIVSLIVIFLIAGIVFVIYMNF